MGREGGVVAAEQERRFASRHREERRHSNDNAPLQGYAGLIVLFSVIAGGLLYSKKHSLPDRMRASDILLLGIATQKVSRLVTKARVTRVVRAPFTDYEKSIGSGEVQERPRGSGWRRAIGELVSCPFCMSTWIACTGILGLIARPPLTRHLASIFAVGSIADFVQQLYGKVKGFEDANPGPR